MRDNASSLFELISLDQTLVNGWVHVGFFQNGG